MDRRIELFRAAFEDLWNAGGEIDLRALAEAAQGPDSRHRVATEDVAGWLADGAVPEQRFTRNFRNLVTSLEESAQGTGYRRKSARFWEEALSEAQSAAAEGERPQSPAAPEPEERHPLLRAVPFGDVLPHESTVLCSEWGAIDGTALLATGTREGIVRLWDVDGEHPAAHELTAGKSLPAPVVQVAWHIDGEISLVSARDAHGAVYVWDAASRDSQVTAVRTVSRWMAWGSDVGSPVLALGQADGFVRLWDPASHAFTADPVNVGLERQDWGEWGTSAGHPAIAVGSSLTGVVALYEPRAKVVQRLQCDPRQALWSAWGQVDGRAVLATAGLSGRVRVWNAATGEQSGALRTGPAYERAWGSWGSRTDGQAVLAVGGVDGSVRLWDPVSNGYYDAQPAGHNGPVNWGAWCTVGDIPVLATGAADGTIRLWDPDNGTQFGEPVLDHDPLGGWGAWGAVDGRPVLATSRDEKTVRLVGLVEDRPLPRLPTYRSDSAVATDELSREGDATAIAELITARTVQPPLAVGLFGDWGEGKSHFMNLLHQRVAETERTGNPLVQQNVRQVRFNAWHYAETDLWASLVAELFAQLSTPPGGDRGDEQRRQSRLTAELVQERGLGERLTGARKRRDELRKALDGDLWKALPAERREELTLLAGKQAQLVFAQATDALGTLRSTWLWARRLLGALPRRTTLLYLTGIVTAVALTVAAYWGLPTVESHLSGWWRRLIAAVPGTSALVVGAVFVRKALLATRERMKSVMKKMGKYGEEVRSRVEIAANLASEEVAALERQLRNMTAAGQLAGLVSDRVEAGQYRGRLGMMTQIREDFQRMARLLAEVAAESDRSTAGPGAPAAAHADVVKDELPRIARIVLYIDDLDRCPSHRVVEVLEAIHLLLAVDLFVVVVAVDPRWLLHAIATHYRGMLSGSAERPAVALGDLPDPDNEELWRLNPAQYLEKIFQVVLTLSPMDTDGYQRLLRTLVGTRPKADEDTSGIPQPVEADVAAGIGASEPTAAGARGGDPVPDAVALSAVGGEGSTPAPAVQSHSWSGPRLPAAEKVDRVDPLTLERDELALLNLLGPPLLVSTPRAVKRLANSYGLLNAIRRDHRSGDLAEQRIELRDPVSGDLRVVTYFPYRAGMVLLALLVAYPTAGPAFFQRLHRRATASPQSSWREFQEEISAYRPKAATEPTDGTYSHTTAVQPDQWRTLVFALKHVTDAAERKGLPLPEPLEAWAAWLVPVSRLSFPTGLMIRPLGWQRAGEDVGRSMEPLLPAAEPNGLGPGRPRLPTP